VKLITPKNKREFISRFNEGEFGNKPRIWTEWTDLRDSDYSGKVTIRHKEPNGPCFYEIYAEDLRRGRLPKGCDELYMCHFNESMPDDLLSIQGNIYTFDSAIRLTYSTKPGLRFREAVTYPYGKFADGLLAHSLLKFYLSPSDYEDLNYLLDTYDDCKVIEFSTYRVNVGVLPNRKTVWWEVRNY